MMVNNVEQIEEQKKESEQQKPDWMVKLKLAFLPDHSQEALKLQSPPLKAESIRIEKIRSYRQSEQSPTLEYFQLQTQTEQDRLEALSFLVNKYETWAGYPLYDEQLLALVRCQKTYHNHQLKGLIAEMMTSEGKSSVIIPIFVAYAGIGEKDIHVHSVNPHLVEELHLRIKGYLTEALGVDPKEVSKLGSVHQQSQKDQDRAVGSADENEEKNTQGLTKYTTGYWADFIHTYQFNFLNMMAQNQRSQTPTNYFPQNALVICDEIDNILKDEASTPAIIAENISTEETVKWLLAELHLFQADTFDQEGKLKVGVGTSDITPTNGQELHDLMRLSLVAINKIIENQKTGDDPELVKILTQKESLRDYLNHTFSQIMFNAVVGTQYLVDGEHGWDEETYKQAHQDLASIDGPFWWDHPEFQQAIIGAYSLERGLDYDVFAGEVKPLAKSGYGELGKEYDSLTQLALCVKENLPWPQTLKAGLPLDNINAAQFYRTFPKIFGFTGSATPVAKRLKDSFNLETTQVPPHNPVLRSERILLTKNEEEKYHQTLNLVFAPGETRNTLLITPNTKEALALTSKLIDQTGKQSVEIKVLSANNEDQDKELYAWLASKDDNKRHILITARMVGRGVNIRSKPGSQVQNEGLLLIASALPESKRAHQQIVGRVGRCGEKAEAIFIVSPDEPSWELLNEKDKTKLAKAFMAGNTQKVNALAEQARQKYELRADVVEQFNTILYTPIIKLGEIATGKVDSLKLSPLEEKFLTYSKKPGFWPSFVYLAEKVFWQNASAGAFGEFNGSSIEANWQILIFKVAEEIYQAI